MVPDGFTTQKISAGEVEIDLAMAGDGYPLVLLHGFPETKMAWHKIVPRLATHFKVIIPDLPGYGDSSAPRSDPTHENHTKRATGNLLLQAIQQLGVRQFALAGHDRGARVAYRMALDHPNQITSLVLLGIIPTLEVMERLTYETAMRMENWFFLSQPRPLPETLINANPKFYLDQIVEGWSEDSSMISPDAREEYLRCFRNPKVIDAICEEYRATEKDLEIDRHDHTNGKRIACPTLVLWSEGDSLASFGDPLTIWKSWADNVRGLALPCGHFLMEEAPEKVFDEMFQLLQRHLMKLEDH
jgi:haloacetate dehalogenase